jgi:hypothetical protein
MGLDRSHCGRHSNPTIVGTIADKVFLQNPYSSKRSTFCGSKSNDAAKEE